MDKNDPRAYLHGGMANAQKKKDFVAAIRDFSRAIKLKPDGGPHGSRRGEKN